MAIYEINGKTPTLADSAWVAQEAVVLGDVTLAANSNIWFGAIIRGDTAPITVGANSNIQDGCVLHVDTDQALKIGSNVTVGHKAVLHSCTVGDGSLIGINAVVLNGAVIGRNCLVGAGALVTEGKIFPDGSLIIGSPAKAVRNLSAEQKEGLIASAQHYVENAQLFRTTLKKIAD